MLAGNEQRRVLPGAVKLVLRRRHACEAGLSRIADVICHRAATLFILRLR